VVAAKSGVVVCIGGLCSIDLYALGLDHGQASIDGLDLRGKLFLGDGARVGLE